MRPREERKALRGFSLIEVMVGIVIGMIAVLVIYQVYSAAEGIKRNTTSVGDAQQNGLLSSFMLNVELANASNGVAYAIKELGTCTSTGNMSTTFRPIPVLITDSGLPTNPDSFVVNYSVSQRVVAPVPFVANAAPGADYQVQSPNGFKSGDLVLAISMGGDCAASRVNAVAGPDVSGIVTLSHTGASVGFTSDAYLLNLGPKGSGQRVEYDVSNNVLRSTALWDDTGAAGANAPNPIASNIVNMKLVYGIDNGAGGVTWTPATGAWSPASVHAATTSTLSKIRAIRIGIVVRGEQWDKTLGNYTWTLFEAPVLLTGTIPAAGGNYRYRVYETTIPLRNPIWNPVS
ncbi:MAG: prepilin-type N-terminal cleavage/methylation domain-containing protein [Betaproteobacteria bacterium]|nr:MAG: prepilin-type N-terminal cleavage/methylation domain-containing protein [Betaproteobacteria bacterium]